MTGTCWRQLVSAIGLSWLLLGEVAGASPLPDPQPVPALAPIEQPEAASSPLIVVPPGCPAPRVVQAVFAGTLVISDAATARFQVDQVRAGSLDGYAVNGLVDVHYGDEVRFLEMDHSYIVGAGTNPDNGALMSSVRPAAPLFGGDEVASINDSDARCPPVEDPVRTLTVDLTSVESGVLTPLGDAKGDLLLAVLEPVGVAFLILSGLAAIKLLVFALARALRDLNAPSERTGRERRHAPR